MAAGVSVTFIEEGQRWLRVSPGHAVSESWLQENAADLYAGWQATPSGEARDRIALQIERRLEQIEAPRTGARSLQRSGCSATDLGIRVAAYEDEARRLGAIAFSDPRRRAAHLAHQVVGDELRVELANYPDRGTSDTLERRLDAADLVADRPLIEAVAGLDAQVDRLVAALAGDGHDVEHWRAVPGDQVAENEPSLAIAADDLNRQRDLPLHVDDDCPAGHDIDQSIS